MLPVGSTAVHQACSGVEDAGGGADVAGEASGEDAGLVTTRFKLPVVFYLVYSDVCLS